MSDVWKKINEDRQNKRWENYKSNISKLEAAQVKFIEKDNGHFIILGDDGEPTHDFWGTTGLIIERETKRRSRGIRNLLRFVKNKK